MVPVTPGAVNMNGGGNVVSPQALFVYGTLLSNYVPKGSNPIVPPATLRTAKLVGRATLRGFKLCDLGRYPCILPTTAHSSNVEEEDKDECVHGELYELISMNADNGEDCWKVLDAYEGISQQYEEPYEYRREVSCTI